jgi:hypothetical protein
MSTGVEAKRWKPMKNRIDQGMLNPCVPEEDPRRDEAAARQSSSEDLERATADSDADQI